MLSKTVCVLILVLFSLQVICSGVEIDFQNDSCGSAQAQADGSHHHTTGTDCPECHVNSCCHHIYMIKSPTEALAFFDAKPEFVRFRFFYKAPFNKGLKRPPIA
ncbi:MAG TPA: hypothetical protein VM432_07175 [Bdellovibrionales bacterium]|nr:hypothetical protein [Bdellovibrionales bacterium]